MAIAAIVHAVDDVTLQIEQVTGEGWAADGVAIELDLPVQAAAARIARLRIDALERELKDVQIACARVELAPEVIGCARARVLVEWPGIGRQSIGGSIRYGRSDGSLALTLHDVRIGAGAATLNAALGREGWKIDARLQRVAVDRLLQLGGELRAPLPPISATGFLTADIKARGLQADVTELSARVDLAELTANNESGSIATDKLTASASMRATRRAGTWQFDIDVSGEQGQAYAEPIFLDVGAHAIAVALEGHLRGTQQLTIEKFSVRHAAVLDAQGSASVDLGHEQPVRALQVQIDSLQLPGAYESYLQPLLVDTSFGTLQTAGNMTASLSIEAGVPRQLDVHLREVSFDDGRAHLGLSGLSGEWHWRADASDASGGSKGSILTAEVPSSRLRWASGVLLGLDLGAAEFAFRTSGRQLRLLEPARVPVLDGAIELDSFRIRNAGLPGVAFMVDATIEPIDVQRLCRAFGWPEFGGRIGGVISKLRMREGVLTLGTQLQAQVFGGTIAISDLRLEQPLSDWPRLYSSIALDNLDLQLVTGAFAFGRITGRLSGAIDGLQLFNWTPVAFDARLYTPENDRSRHRISQRAVENIGSIGGGGAGVTAALSSGLLRFFEEFNYDRLGISCRLQNDICVMDGIAPAPNGGYYLVKGRGVPRIDVIGSSRRVDWPRLVQQLAAATRSSGPIVEP